MISSAARSDPAAFIGALFVMAMGVVVVVVIVGAVLSARRSTEKFFDGAARRLKGRFVPAGLLRYPRIEFSLAGRAARIEFVPAGEEDSGCTRLLVPIEGLAGGTLHILPEGFGQSFLKMFGAQDLSIGDRAFDAAYVVKANPETLAGRVFRPDRRARVIAAVRHLEGLRRPTIQVTVDQLRVQTNEQISNQGDLLRLVKTAGEFLDFLRVEPPISGIELGAMRVSRDSSCPVCGSKLGVPLVRCETCRTPHHEECWRYVGQCSTYACQEKRFVASG